MFSLIAYRNIFFTKLMRHLKTFKWENPADTVRNLNPNFLDSSIGDEDETVKRYKNNIRVSSKWAKIAALIFVAFSIVLTIYTLFG